MTACVHKEAKSIGFMTFVVCLLRMLRAALSSLLAAVCGRRKLVVHTLQVRLVGPSVVGSYYGRGDQVANRKGDFGRLLVLASNHGAAASAGAGACSNRATDTEPTVPPTLAPSPTKQLEELVS